MSTRPRHGRVRAGTRGLAVLAALLVGVASTARTAHAKDIDATDVTESGLHAALTQTSGSDKNGKLLAFGIQNSHMGFGNEGPATIRVVNVGGIAVGSTGIEGGISNAVAGGLRLPVTKRQGFVLRGGGEGNFFGNKYLWDSSLELPQFQLGYQWLKPVQVFDIAAKGGYILLGRHNTGDAAVRHLDGSFEWGAIANVHLGPVDLRATFTRVEPRHDGNNVNMAIGAFCGNAKPFVLCTDFRYERGDVRLLDGSIRDSRVSYVGFTIGFVPYEKKPKKK